MEFTGRLVADAEIKKTKNNKEYVAFTVVVNDYYKPKDGEAKEFSEFFNCAYWLTSKVADNLLKGCIVAVTGRIYLNEYVAKDGSKHASLACHVNSIKIIATAKKNGAASKAPIAEGVTEGEPTTTDDLPF